MLRLWPERWMLTLLADQACLLAGRSVHDSFTDVGEAGAWEARVRQLLAVPQARRGLRPTLDVLVGNHLGRLMLLPWQNKLNTEEQQRRYAEACFDGEGLSGRDWVVQAAYRRYGSAGVAIAVRREALAVLANLSETRGARLRSMLPVAAAAYWRHRPRRRGVEVLLLDEGRCLSALCYANGVLRGIDVQSAGAERELALTRLLRRCELAHGAARHLVYWCGVNQPFDESVLSTVLPGASLQQVRPGAWQ